MIDGRLEPLIYSAVSIVRSVPDQDFGGTLVMLRRLNQTLFDDIREFTQLDFHLYSRAGVLADSRLAGLAAGLPSSDSDTGVRRQDG